MVSDIRTLHVPPLIQRGIILPTALFVLFCKLIWQGRLLRTSIGMISLEPLLCCIGHERESRLQGGLKKILPLMNSPPVCSRDES